MKKFIALGLTLLIVLAGCSTSYDEPIAPGELSGTPLLTATTAGGSTPVTRDETTERTTHEPDFTPEPEPRTAENTLHEAFYNAFSDLFYFDYALNHEIKYVAVDLSNVFDSVREQLTALIQASAEKYGTELIVATFDELVEQGFINLPPDKDGFRDGLHFAFSNAVLDGETLMVEVSKYRGPLGAVWIEYTVRFENGEWIVEPPTLVAVA
jgi:hypothetical protein